MTKTLIGTGVTDSNGVATLSKDPNNQDIGGYTGTGAGEVELSASATIDGTTIDSQPYTIYDVPLPISISLSLSTPVAKVGQTVTLTATVTEGGEAVSGGTVVFKKNGTQIGTGTTNSSGVATYSYETDVDGTLSITATYSTQTSTASTLTVSKTNTALSITVPQLVYSDVFDITGVLEDSSNNKISGATVKLTWEVDGVQHDVTETTDSNGEVTFHRSAPTEIQTYDFWLSYSGSNKYVASQSSVENRTVGKETTVLTVTSPLDSSTQYDTVPVTGTLLSNDGEAMASKSVYVKENGTTLATLTTDSNGAFSGTLSELSTGSHTLTIEFVTDTYYTASTTSRTITLTTAGLSLSVSPDPCILSYVDEDEATLTAVYTGPNPANRQVMFYSGNPNVTTNDCTSSTDFTIISGSPTFASTGMTVHEDVDKVMLSEDLFDLSEGSYNIRLTCTKPSDSTSWFGGGISLSTGQLDYITGVFVDESDVYFLDSSFTLPSDLDDTINISIELTPSSQRIYINNELVGSTSHDYTEEIGGIKVWSDYNYLNFWKLHDDFEVNNIVVYDSSTTDYLDFDATDSNGVASVTYQSKGTGDITIQASCNNITSSTVTIEDCLMANGSGTKSGTTPEWHSLYQLDSPVDAEVSATLTFSRNQSAFFFGESISSAYSSISISDTNQNPPKYIELLGASAYDYMSSASWSYPVDVKFRYENGVATVYIGGVQQAQASMSISPVYIGVRYWSGSYTTITYSNLKIKKL